MKATPTRHTYATDDVAVTMNVFTGIGGPMPLLIFEREGNRMSVEITHESGNFLLNAVSDALNHLDDAAEGVVYANGQAVGYYTEGEGL